MFIFRQARHLNSDQHKLIKILKNHDDTTKCCLKSVRELNFTAIKMTILKIYLQK